MNPKSKIKNLKYADFSHSGDRQLKLISSMLLKIQGRLEEDELHSLGEFIISYFNKKILLDHVFWERSVDLCHLNDEEIENEIIQIRNNLCE
ncbi:MAG: hypothetical protein PHY93_19925 [Bacteriovorax sp.]|nr:hypothetical protein [Bacteriovorax sp.]